MFTNLIKLSDKDWVAFYNVYITSWSLTAADTHFQKTKGMDIRLIL